MGTVLSLFQEPLQKLVWTGKLDILSMSSAPEQGASPSNVRKALVTAGRELEIFLDMMAAYATDNHSYLLAPAYNQGLGDDELALRRQLLALANQDRSAGTAEVWGVLDKALRELGLPELS
jgi:hypothetical protein